MIPTRCYALERPAIFIPEFFGMRSQVMQPFFGKP